MAIRSRISWVGLLFVAFGWMAFLFAPAIRAQAPPPVTAPVFEVATIRPSDPNATGARFGLSRGHFVTTNQTVKNVMRFAYDLNSEDQIAGGPSWIGSAKFDIEAKEDDSVAAQMQKLPAEQQMALIRPMVLALLQERFKLK